jgi:hypothetical protein
MFSDPLAIARSVHAVLFAANVMLAGVLAWLAAGRWSGAFPLAALLAAASIALLKVHAQAWSEPLFLTLTFGGFAMLASHLAAPSPPRLIAACGLSAAALLTRYAGLPILPTGSFALLCWSKRPRAERAQEAALYLVTGLLPLGAWLLKALITAPSSRPADRALAFHPVGVAQVREGLDTVAGWLIAPEWLPLGFRLVALVVLAALVVWAFVHPRDGTVHGGSFPELLRLLGTFVPIYLAFVLVTISFGSADTPLDDRILVPICFAGIVVGVAGLVRASPTGRVVLAGILLLVVAANATQSWRYAREAHANGIGYASRRYVTSRLVDYVRHLSHQTVVVSNAARVLYIHTGRHVRSLPAKYNPSSLAVNDGFASELAKLTAESVKTPILVVYFDKRRHDYIPTPDELRTHVVLTPVKTIRHEGTVYRLGPEAPSARHAS